MIVLDASAAIDLLLRREPYDELADVLLQHGETLHAPHLVDVEVVQVLRRLELSGHLLTRRAVEALSDLGHLGLIRYAHEPLKGRAWALRKTLGGYDAMYVALAEALGAPLVTTDRKLAAAPGHRALVRLYG